MYLKTLLTSHLDELGRGDHDKFVRIAAGELRKVLKGINIALRDKEKGEEI